MSQSLNQLINSDSRISPRQVALMQQPAVEAIALAREQGWNAPLTPEAIIIDEDSKTVTIDTTQSAATQQPSDLDDVRAYGKSLNLILEATPTSPRKLKTIATRCVNAKYGNLGEVHLALEKRVSNTIYVPIIIFIIAAMVLIWWLNKSF